MSHLGISGSIFESLSPVPIIRISKMNENKKLKFEFENEEKVSESVNENTYSWFEKFE